MTVTRGLFLGIGDRVVGLRTAAAVAGRQARNLVATLSIRLSG